MDYTGREAKIKAIVGMVCSSIQAVTRCKINSGKLGGLGVLLSFLAIGIIGLSGAKVYFAHKCQSHLWNLSSGCVKIATETIMTTPETIVHSCKFDCRLAT